MLKNRPLLHKIWIKAGDWRIFFISLKFRYLSIFITNIKTKNLHQFIGKYYEKFKVITYTWIIKSTQLEAHWYHKLNFQKDEIHFQWHAGKKSMCYKFKMPLLGNFKYILKHHLIITRCHFIEFFRLTEFYPIFSSCKRACKS